MVLDENDTRALRIAFRDKKRGGPRLAAPETSAHGIVIGSDKCGGGPIGECF